MLKAEHLGYQYGKSKFHLKDVSFSLEDGYIMCLLGRNGAGKTTLLKEIYGALQPSTGYVCYNEKTVVAAKGQGRVLKEDFVEYHNEVAFVGELSWYLPELSIEENVNTLKMLYHHFDEEEYRRIVAFFDLPEECRNMLVSELSTGQKMLFQVAFAMARHPKLILFDEPFANLDPVVKVDLAQLLQDQVRGENIQVILSTHLVDDISDFVDYIGVMENGEMTVFGDRETVLTDHHVGNIRELLMGGEK